MQRAAAPSLSYVLSQFRLIYPSFLRSEEISLMIHHLHLISEEEIKLGLGESESSKIVTAVTSFYRSYYRY